MYDLSILHATYTTAIVLGETKKYQGYVKFVRVRTRVYRGYLFGEYPTEPYRSVRYGLNTLPTYTGVFGDLNTGIGTSVSSVRLQYRYPIRYPTLR